MQTFLLTLCVFPKGFTGGYLPTALAVTTQKIYDAFILIIKKERHLCIAIPIGEILWHVRQPLKSLNILEEEPILQNANRNAPYLTNLIREELEDYHYVGDIRSIGLINAIELVQDKASKTSFDSSHRYGYQIYKTALKKDCCCVL